MRFVVVLFVGVTLLGTAVLWYLEKQTHLTEQILTTKAQTTRLQPTTDTYAFDISDYVVPTLTPEVYTDSLPVSPVPTATVRPIAKAAPTALPPHILMQRYLTPTAYRTPSPPTAQKITATPAVPASIFTGAVIAASPPDYDVTAYRELYALLDHNPVATAYFTLTPVKKQRRINILVKAPIEMNIVYADVWMYLNGFSHVPAANIVYIEE